MSSMGSRETSMKRYSCSRPGAGRTLEGALAIGGLRAERLRVRVGAVEPHLVGLAVGAGGQARLDDQLAGVATTGDDGDPGPLGALDRAQHELPVDRRSSGLRGSSPPSPALAPSSSVSEGLRPDEQRECDEDRQEQSTRSEQPAPADHVARLGGQLAPLARFALRRRGRGLAGRNGRQIVRVENARASRAPSATRRGRPRSGAAGRASRSPPGPPAGRAGSRRSGRASPPRPPRR